MVTHEALFRIAESLPGSLVATDPPSAAVEVKGKPKGYFWTWLERTDPKKARVPNPNVIALRVPNLTAKEMLLESVKGLFTEAHYNGFPAVLVRLEEIEEADLTPLVVEAWRCVAPKQLQRQYDSES